MDNCLHSYFVRNDELVSCCDFNANSFADQGYVYEVLRVIGGVPLFLEDHLQRMWYSLASARVDTAITPHFIKSVLRQLIDINKVDIGTIKVVIGKPYKLNAPHFAAWFQQHSYPSQKSYDEGVDISFLDYERKTPTAKIWRENYQQLIAEKKKQFNLFELLLTSNDKVTEGSKSNFFIVKNDTLYTSPEAEVLNGITRIKVISLAHDAAIKVVEKSISKAAIYQADALFLTGTSPKVLPVSKLYPEKLFDTQNEIMRKLMQAYDTLIVRYINENKA